MPIEAFLFISINFSVIMKAYATLFSQKNTEPKKTFEISYLSGVLWPLMEPMLIKESNIKL
ncbi:hypothetical protein BpHYR1_010563 [Brachionus plicatilis]|uniref:Uncharacterized protein n=1 Tax=Brachionus plicatilis TaxID=10195 RepID=A0A3M7T8B5_BRAPC|nr:hypothetical protein BpHYR1_010563 [Brachionus plicatilis]